MKLIPAKSKGMKSKALGIAAATLFSSVFSGGVFAQTLNAAYWQWYDLVGGAQGGYISEGAFGLDNAPATQSGNTVTLAPNTSVCGDNLANNDAGGIDYWCTVGKWVVMSTFEAELVPAGSPSDAAFRGCFASNTTANSTVRAFVKVFAGDYSQQFASEFSDPNAQCWDISIPVLGDVDVNVQKGFELAGPNADPRDGDPGAVVALIGANKPPRPPVGGDRDPNAIPTLPSLALGLLVLMAGWLGQRQLRNRR